MQVEVQLHVGMRRLILLRWGLEPDATWDQVRARYRELAFRFHPDRGGDPEMFQRVQAQYETLEALW